MSPSPRARTRSSLARLLLTIGSALLMWLPSTAAAQTAPCDSAAIKEEVAKALTALDAQPADSREALEAELYEKYQFCLQNAVPSSTFANAARACGATVSNLGSLFFEEMSCCGYDPQRRQFACPVKIKQNTGFGGTPLPGSREHVLHCVADAAGVLQPVGRDSVHLSNAIAGSSPTWQFAVIAAANQNLQTVYPMNGQTRRARSILSWGFTPNGCNFVPIWGNALNYRIRLDQ
jgi:hypothetical protein